MKLRLLLAFSTLVSLVSLVSLRAAEAKPKFTVEETTIAQIHQAILAKKLTSTELVKLYLARIKAYNGRAVEEPEGILKPVQPRADARGVNALITLNLRPAARQAWGFDERKARSLTDAADADPKMPDALETAAALDDYFAKTGRLIGPLHGVVIAVKDQYDTFDMRTTSGADAFYANDRPPDDATFVARLRAAGAIILAKANMGEYASGIRSAFGGTTVNAYDTSRVPGGSSGGSGVAAAMSFCTVAIGEESGPSIRAPSTYANCVGISATQELVSRDGMMNIGFNTRTGPIARTVEDAARVLTVIAGYDPKDEMTAFAVGRLPGQPYETFTQPARLDGIRIGVVREYMDRKIFSEPIYEPQIAATERAIEDLKKLGATIVDAPAEGMFTACIRRYYPMLMNATWTKAFPDLFPVDASGKATSDHIATLLDLLMDPAKVPGKVTLRDISGGGAGGGGAIGESRFGYNLYLRQRGDANIRVLTDLANKANFFEDAAEANKKLSLQSTDRPLVYDTAVRLQRRFAIQQIVLACMAELKLDAFVYPTSLIPPRKVGAPRDPSFNGIGNYGMWTFLGQQGFPALTIPGGFTSEVWDRVPDPDAAPIAASGAARRGSDEGEGGRGEPPSPPLKLVGPTPAKLPIGIDFLGRPFSEPLLLKIAAAYEAATHHRAAPPRFGPVSGDVSAGSQ
jgi:Asp-tRNA(Asn)/Glu-tRNA(Gln) amidotransferase A subunit family amidase